MRKPGSRFHLTLLFLLFVLFGFSISAHRIFELTSGGKPPLARHAINPPPARAGRRTAPGKTAGPPDGIAARANDAAAPAPLNAGNPALEPAQSGGSFNFTQASLTSGGGTNTSAANQLTGSIGQGLLGSTSAGSFSLTGGFWGNAVFATITVNTTADTVAMDGLCSLREAIQAANSNTAVNECQPGTPGLDTIQFDIGAGTPVINVTSPLPTITESLSINGNTGGATRVELNGTGVSGSGLLVQTGNSTIKNMVINRFGLAGIVLTSGNGNVVQGCFLGTDATGTLDRGNATNGIFISSANNLIGGTTPAMRNVISGNDQDGVALGFAAGANNVVQGNFIGTDLNGTAALGNSGQGVHIDSGASGNTIGGTVASAGNIIAFNNGRGVFINQNTTINNRVSSNAIFSNGTLGIDLNSDGGVTANDAGDPDTGPNNVQNFPVLNFVTSTGVINGSLDSTVANSAYPVRLEFFANTACDSSGNGEGEVFLGSTVLNAPGSFNFTASLVAGKNFITATATDNNGNTSEFSACRVVNTVPAISAVAVSRQQGSPVTTSTIANVSDANQAANTLAVTVNGGASATVNGVTVSGISVSAGGVVTANVIASCAATTASFTLTVTDNVSEVSTATLSVTVTANTAPTLSYNSNPSVTAGGAIMINPLTGPSDNGSVNTIVVQSQGTYTGTISVNLAGVVSISNAAPAGTHTITIRATDNCGTTTDAAFSLTVICPAITVNPFTLPAGTTGAAYSQSLTATGGTAPYTFNVSAGTLPNGLTLSSGGALTGTPTVAGTFNFTAQATDTIGCQGTRSYSLTINPSCPTITVNPSNPTLPPGQAAQPYSQTFTQTGGNGSITWSVSTGALPNGLTLNPATGLLSGTPVVFGTFNFIIRATDGNNCTGERAYTLTINNFCATIAPANQTVAAIGGTGLMVNVTGPGGCNWTAVSNAPWITVTGGSSGNGNGTVSYTVAASASALPRTGTMTIAGRTFYVNQIVPGLIISEDFEGGIPSTWTVIDGGSGGGANSTWKAVNIANVCPSFAAPLPAPFVGMVALANGSLECVGAGSTQEEQLITPSFNATGLGRVVLQFLNQFKLDSSLGSTHIGDVDVSLDGGTNWVNVLHQIANNGVPTPALLTLDITGFIASNPTNVRLRFHFFGQIPSFNRPTGGSIIEWPIDAFRVTYLAISPTSQSFPASGGPGSVSVTVAAGDPWTAQSNAPWLTGVTPGGTGSGTVNYTVAVNATGAPRSGTLTIAGNTFTVNQAAGTGLQFFPLPQPVRLLETRAGFSGCTTPGAPINANGTLTLPARTTCAGIPAAAAAVTGNITVVPSGPGFLTLFPSSATQPTVANSNFQTNEITNNVFTVGLGATDGAFKIFSSATTHVIVDVTGYYAPPNTGGLYFHPLATPVRLLETRVGFTGCITPGAPLVGTGNPNADPNLDLLLQGRSPVAAPCNSIPATAQVLVGNATSVLPTGLGYLTIYPSGGTRPTVASSNYAGNDVINGPFAVKLGTDGKFKIYTFATTHLVVDILGYYSADATDANGAGLLFNPLPSPVRLLETRAGLNGCTMTGAPIVGNLNAATHTQMAANFCTLPASAQAVVGNASVVNTTGAGFLTLFPANLTTAPLVATSNYPAPATFGYNRHFFVGLSPADGKFKVLTQFTTDLILDASGYFAP